jgi:hypothetical protein
MYIPGEANLNNIGNGNNDLRMGKSKQNENMLCEDI